MCLCFLNAIIKAGCLTFKSIAISCNPILQRCTMENQKEHMLFMTPAQLQTELLRCEYCEEKPCKEACPAHCSPADFIMAARVGNPSDIRRSAAEIMHANPMGGVCGMVCPDTLCMAACTRKKFDGPINIPLVQATIVEMAKNLGGIRNSPAKTRMGKKWPLLAADQPDWVRQPLWRRWAMWWKSWKPPTDSGG